MRKQEFGLSVLADTVGEGLEHIYSQKMDFILLVSVNGESEGVADYISTSERETAIEWMKETIKRFEANEIIPVTEGAEQ